APVLSSVWIFLCSCYHALRALHSFPTRRSSDLGSRIVGWDRRRDMLIDEAGVVEKFGVRPQSIPDWLGLVGDAADGFPGIPGWGEKSAAAVLAKYEHLEAIPADPQTWGFSASRAARLAESLAQHWAEALLFRKLATLRE